MARPVYCVGGDVKHCTVQSKIRYFCASDNQLSLFLRRDWLICPDYFDRI